MGQMTKLPQADFVRGVAEEAGLHPKDVKRVFDAMKSQIMLHTTEGVKVAIQGFGSWEPREVKAKDKVYSFGKNKGESYTTRPKVVVKHKVALKNISIEE
jgi:nucleoid DNA-binding protein